MSNRKPSTATSRLMEDYLRLKKDPVPYVVAEPLPSNILEWHYVVVGPEDTPYEDGVYHGKLVFPPEFPFKPPSIYMITPNGRFKTNTRLCLSMSDFHPDTWNPAWSVSTILTGFVSFMIEESPAVGSIESSKFDKWRLSDQSLEFNLKDKTFHELFPDLVTDIKAELERRAEEDLAEDELAEEELTGEELAEEELAIWNNPRLAVVADAYGRELNELATNDQSPFQSALANICVIIGVVAFVFTFRYVLRNVSME